MKTSAERMRQWRLNNPEKARESYRRDNAKRKSYRDKYYSDRKETYKEKSLLRYHGLTLVEFDQMVEDQDYQCSICHTDFRTLPLKNIHVDHSHKNGKIRSILCNKCNQGLGLFQDSAQILRSAIKYLEMHDG